MCRATPINRQTRAIVALAMIATLSSAVAEANCAHPGCNGIHFSAAYTGDLVRNMTGGIRSGNSYIDNVDLQLSADRGSIFGIPGLSGLVYVLHNNGADFSEKYVGDAQVVSNIDGGPDAWRLYEAWLDWAPGAGTISARLGLYDLNTEFDAIETAGLFLNGAQGMGTDFGQTGENGPSIFPVTSLAFRLHVASGNGAYGQVAVLDGVPGDPDDPSSNEIDLSRDDGALLVIEAGWSGGDWRKLAIGAWQYTATFDTLVGTDDEDLPLRRNGNAGIYGIADRTLWRGESATVAGFLRLGHAAGRFNQFDTYLGTGATLTGFWPARADDEIGLAIAATMTSDDYREAQRLTGADADHHETNIELTWRAPVTDWLTLQPGVQYIVNPGADAQLGNAVVAMLRFELSWSL